jgi:hypothetical protein
MIVEQATSADINISKANQPAYSYLFTYFRFYWR